MTAERFGVRSRRRGPQSAGAIVEPRADGHARQRAHALRRRGEGARRRRHPIATRPAPRRTRSLDTSQVTATNARRDVERGLAAYRAFYDVLPERMGGDVEAHRAAVRARSGGRVLRALAGDVVAQLAETFRAQRIDAMIYPTMPFPAPRAVDPWPDVRTTLGYGNWLGFPEMSVPSGIGADGMPAGNISFVGLPGSDARLLALAHSYERRLARFVAPPNPKTTEL